MAKQKSKKRKQIAQAEGPRKLSKTAAKTITPPPDGAPQFAPTNLHTVVSDEELDITVETLATLAQHPSLLKSKACRDLRAAVYDFRQACTTGANNAGMYCSRN